MGGNPQQASVGRSRSPSVSISPKPGDTFNILRQHAAAAATLPACDPATFPPTPPAPRGTSHSTMESMTD